MDVWLNSLRNAKKTCIVQGGVKKVHYLFSDGTEMAEEYNMDTQVVTRRAWKVDRIFGAEPKWEVEVGDPTSFPSGQIDQSGIQETNNAPVTSKRLTKACIEWRIRNLPYSIETYKVTADNSERCITVRTENKKFFKKINVPDLDRLRLPIEQNRITVSHKFNTLIISYKKPVEMVTMEKLLLEEINRMDNSKESTVQCPTS